MPTLRGRGGESDPDFCYPLPRRGDSDIFSLAPLGGTATCRTPPSTRRPALSSPTLLVPRRRRLSGSLTCSRYTFSVYGLLHTRGWSMRHLKGVLGALLAQESGQIQFFIIAPILTLSF